MRSFHKNSDWLYFLFWMMGIFYISCLKLNFKEAMEVTYWIRIHINHSGQCLGYTKRTFWKKIKNYLIVFFGLIITLGIVYLLIYKYKKLL
jgi:hypothetical protein